MEQPDLVRFVTELLERLKVPYMLVGSMASMVYGEARFTHDIDIVVDFDLRTVELLCAAFSDPDFYVSLPAAQEAVRRRRPFNVIHSKSGNKIDFMVSREDEWGRNQIARRQQTLIFPDLMGYVAAPEDVILGKLQYYREGESDKHLRDIAAMLQVSGDQIDRDDVSRWAAKLDVLDIWQAILARVDSAPQG
ncbi:MAG: hypothetical protein H7062_06775 [Candidatus Saccharimonas sp.]|nr:hypothetical protein [Planctomycetaceae bacterium]